VSSKIKMSMYKRPSQRVKCPPPIKGDKPREGTFLYDIINTKPTTVYEYKKAPVYDKHIYLRFLEKNNKQLGIPYKEPELPDAAPYEQPKPSDEPELEFGDRVQVVLKVLKSGIVRVKVNGAIATMYEKYYKQGKQPPIKTIIQAYKAHGFSKEFLEKIKKNHEKKMTFAKKVPNILEKIFDKEPVKKQKKEKKKEPVEEIENDAPEEEEEEDDVPDEEGQMDIEPDEEEVVEEEEYFSEPET
jgi:hypothetical protein